MTAPKPVILGIDEDRVAQARIADAFNGQGVFYRFITDRRKLAAGVRQISPDLLIVTGDLGSDFVIQVLDGLAADPSSASLPVVVVSHDTSDAPFVAGLRSGVVAIVPPPFDEGHALPTRALWEELANRPGTSSGTGDSEVLQRLVDHIRRARRSGIFTVDPRTTKEGRATFVHGKLQRATFSGSVGPEALKNMLALSKAAWSFSEVSGHGGEGAGVVIEVGDVSTGETEVAVVVGQSVEDEPLAFEVPDEIPGPLPSAPITAPTPVSGSPVVRLLLVDDDESLVRMFSTLFAKHGFQVTTANDGQQGADLALQRDFDLVFADLNMPHLDGWGMLRILRDDFRTRELPIAFISAHDDYRESLRALNAGAQAYLSKGVRLDTLISQARKLLEPRSNALAQLLSGQAFSFSVASLGPQWALRQFALRYLSGRLEVKDGWASYTLVFNGGTCVNAQATAGKYTAEGERAFNAFIASRAAEATWTPGAQQPSPQNLFLSTEVLIERACATLNDNERRMRETLLIGATQIEVNPELYEVYRQVGPKTYLEVARLVCEERLTPREVIAKLDMSPVDIEETMKDLLRRGVVTLKRQQP
jgi:DNA-binding response OmpR family regulator